MKEDHKSLLIKNILFGRQKEMKLLTEHYALVREGYRSIVHISGAYGLGKSKLIDTFRSSLKDLNVLFLQGQFSQSEGSSPKEAFIQAIRQFAKTILSKDNQVVEAWKIILKETLQVTSKALIQMIPDLVHLTGQKSTGIPDRSVNINFPFSKLIKSIPSVHNPLILVLRDMQYADKDSWDTLLTLVKDRNIKYLLIITTSDESFESESFQEYLDLIKEFDKVHLSNYTPQEIHHTLENLHFKEALKFSELLFAKTKGYPQACSYLLEKLLANEQISFNEVSESWEWDQESIAKIAPIGQGVNFYAEVYDELDGALKTIFQYSSLLGQCVFH